MMSILFSTLNGAGTISSDLLCLGGVIYPSAGSNDVRRGI
jgi:hypothetical protein